MSAIVSAGCCCNQQIPPCTALLLQHACYDRLRVAIGVRMEYTLLRNSVTYERPCATWNGEIGPCICPAQLHTVATGGFDFDLYGQVRRSSCGQNWFSGTGSEIPRWSLSSWRTEYQNCLPYWQCPSYGFRSLIQTSGQGTGGGLYVGCCSQVGGEFGSCVPCNFDELGAIPPIWTIEGTIGNQVGFPTQVETADGTASYSYCNGDVEMYPAYAGISGTFSIEKIAVCNSVPRAPWGDYGGCAPWKTRFEADVDTGFSVEEQGQTFPAGSHPDRLGTFTPNGLIDGPEPHCELGLTPISIRQWTYQSPSLPYDTFHVVGTRTVFASVIPIT